MLGGTNIIEQRKEDKAKEKEMKDALDRQAAKLNGQEAA